MPSESELFFSGSAVPLTCRQVAIGKSFARVRYFAVCHPFFHDVGETANVYGFGKMIVHARRFGKPDVIREGVCGHGNDGNGFCILSVRFVDGDCRFRGATSRTQSLKYEILWLSRSMT